MLQCCLFKAYSISYFALRALGLSCLLFWSRACVTAAYFIVQSHFIHFTTFHPLRWVSFRFVHFSRFSQCRLPTFQLACFVVRASVNRRLFFPDTHPTLKNKHTHCPCVVRRVAQYNAKIFCICHTGNIVCTRTRRYLLVLPCCTPSLHSQVARRTTDCKPFHSVSLHSLFATVPHRQPQALLPSIQFLVYPIFKSKFVV